MESRQIVAVVLIIVIIGGVGLGVYLMLPPPAEPPYGQVQVGRLVTPGAPAGTPSDHIINVGILDPMFDIQGIGAWKGAYLACDEINTAGGVVVDGETYYFGIIAEDTDESAPTLDISKGTAAATKIITEDNAQFIIGGFRTEAVLAYLETVMDEDMLFFGTGASTDIFCQKVALGPWPQPSGPDVISDYDRYKYFFRLMPINSTSLASSLLRYILWLDGYLSQALSLNISKVAIIREGLDWTAGMSQFLNGYLPGYGFEIVHEVAYPVQTVDAAAFATYWSQIDAAGAQITIPIISAQGGILMTTQYAISEPKTMLAGIDVMSQLDSYWNETDGGCAYEVVLQSTLRTNKTERTIDFWDAFLDAYGSEPLYTAVGSYDAMYILAEGIFRAQSFNSTEIVPYLEMMDTASPFVGAGGNIAFTPTHDLFEGPLHSYTLFCQWQPDGTKQVVSSGNLIYPDSIVTAPLAIPEWGINP
ncbi:MAG: ABC transporter substrate-binding protein [Candidatus Thorarchaeota archaeon]